ncbi:MAG: RNA 2',3'-cyclic phosphodiesterase [Candidatus Omnitrophica bacterium]|nr:RNA 2',3'-cyclic phosphodiesterase [Candidatus Omnitrophota bacterium]
MRAFIGIALPDDIRGALAVLQQELAGAQADVRWVLASHLHVTLKFLGEMTDAQRQAVEALLERVAARESAFLLGLSGAGAFPSIQAPRVVWVGLSEGREAVARIGQAIEDEIRLIGLRREDRPLTPHLTLGRVRSSKRRSALTQRLQESAWEVPSPWRVTSLTLYQSVLGSAGPRYTVLAEVPLRGVRRP